jgi:hypothetical protein
MCHMTMRLVMLSVAIGHPTLWILSLAPGPMPGQLTTTLSRHERTCIYLPAPPSPKSTSVESPQLASRSVSLDISSLLPTFLTCNPPPLISVRIRTRPTGSVGSSSEGGDSCGGCSTYSANPPNFGRRSQEAPYLLGNQCRFRLTWSRGKLP